MKLKNIISIIALAYASTIASAQEYTLDSCRNLAVRNNKTIRVADEAIQGVGYERKAAKAAYLPGIDFNGGYMYNQRTINLLSENANLPTMTFDPVSGNYLPNILLGPDLKPVMDPSTGLPVFTEVAVIPKEAMSFDTHNVVAGALTLTQPVYMGGQIKALNEIAKYAEQATIAARNSAVQEIVFGVDQAYWLVVSLKSKKKLAESFVTLVDTLRYSVNAMVEEGVATRSDLLMVDVKLNEAKIALTKVDNGLTLSRMALAQLCGLPVQSNMQLADEDYKPYSPAAPEVSYNINEVYAKRQDLEVLRQGISVLAQKEKLTMGSMLPKVAVIGAYEFSNPNLNDGFKKRFGGGFSVGATVSIPIWHWGENYNRYRAAKSATNAQRLLLEDMEDKVSLQVEQAKFSFQEAFKTY
ncbi:MAG: TolC family protein, partial [Muribaculaceae bacterium]|nr:TolC family protein [Muribaculaceae bacterium]